MSLDSQTNQPVTDDFNKERDILNSLINSFKTEREKCEVRRKARENKRNVEEEKSKGVILADETIIPDHTIDLNIRRGRVPYLNYVMRAKNVLTITDINDPKRDTSDLELWFSRGMRYPHWKIPWYRLVDGMQLHGGCAMEVIYDPSKPLKVSLEYIPRNELIIPEKTKDIQACPRLPREYEITLLQLEEFATAFNFDANAVEKLTMLYKDRPDEFFKIYRVLCKKQGIVYNEWYSPDCDTHWLRPPMPHQIGLFNYDERFLLDMKAVGGPIWEAYRIQTTTTSPLPLKQYPISWFKFDETEDEHLLKQQGRAALDLPTQEALTHLLTNTVNGTTRASGLYASADGEPGADPKMLENITLKHGGAYSGKSWSFFQPPWPQPIIMQIMQVLDLRKAQESGNADFAALARKDANKTATEMDLAAEQSSDQQIISLGSFSSPYLDIYALAFNVAKQQATFDLCTSPPDKALLFGTYQLEPSGDIELIKRSEDKRNAMQFFDILRGTPAADKVLTFLITKLFPDQAEDWLQAMNSPNKDGIIVALLNVVKSIPTDELNPAQQQQLQSLVNAAQAVVAGSSNTSPVTDTSIQAGQPPVGSDAAQPQ